MATTAVETIATAEWEAEIRNEMAEIRKDIAALTKALGGYGKTRAEGVQASVMDFTEEMLGDSRRAVKKLSKRAAKIEKRAETAVRDNPLPWFLGTLGIGLVIAMLTRHDG